MTVKDLIEELQKIQKVHPDVETIESRTNLGRKSNHIVVGLKDHVVLIEGAKL